MKTIHLTLILVGIALIGCEHKPKELVSPSTANLNSCKLERISNQLYIQYNKDGLAQLTIFKDSTDKEGHEEIYESFYTNGKLTSYNQTFRSIISSEESSVSIAYTDNSLVSEIYYHEGLGCKEPPYLKTSIFYDNLRNRNLLLRYRWADDGFWNLEDSIVMANFVGGRPQLSTNYRSSGFLFSQRMTYDINGNLTLVEIMEGEEKKWRKSIEYSYSPTVKNYLNLLPKAFLLDEYAADMNEGTKDFNTYATTKKISYTNYDNAGNLLPVEKIENSETNQYLSTNALGYPTKMNYTDSEFPKEITPYTFQYSCK